MNKTELIAAVAENAGMTKKDAERVLNAAIDTVTHTLRQGGKGLTEEQRETFYASAQIILDNLSHYPEDGEEA